MGKVSKKTKKFERSHLQDEIKQRKRMQRVNATRQKREQRSIANRERAAADEEQQKKKQNEDEAKILGTLSSGQPQQAGGSWENFLSGDFTNFMEQQSDADEFSDDEESDDASEDAAKENEFGQPFQSDEDDDAGQLSKAKGEIKQHKKDLEQLKKKDPEFYKFLQENDGDLLDISDDSEAEEMEGEEEDSKENHQSPSDEEDDQPARQVTLAEVNKQIKQVKKNSTALQPLRRLVQAFQSAVSIQDSNYGDADLRIVDGEVFQTVMTYCLNNMREVFDKYLEIDGTKKPSSSSRWKRFRAIAKVYLASLVHGLVELSDPIMALHLLRHAATMVPYLQYFPKISKNLLRATMKALGGSEEALRIQAFLLSRSLALEMPFPFIESVFKGVYITFQRNTKFTTNNNKASQQFLAQCVTEIYSLDRAAAYEHGFVYLRQLAIELRAALTKKSKEAVGHILSWKFLNSFELWARLICALPDEDSMGPLAYPLIQIGIGCLRFAAGARLVPFRLHICRALQRVAETLEIYVPLSPHLLAVLDLPELSSKPKGGGPPVEMEFVLRLSKTVVKRSTAADALGVGALALLQRHLAQHCRSPAFPELFFPIGMSLKKFSKESQSAKLRKLAKDLHDRCSLTSQWCENHREKVEFKPESLHTIKFLSSNSEKDKPVLEKYQGENKTGGSDEPAEIKNAGQKSQKQVKIDDQDAEDSFDEGNVGSSDDGMESDEESEAEEGWLEEGEDSEASGDEESEEEEADYDDDKEDELEEFEFSDDE